MIKRIGAGTTVAAVLTAVTLAAWPASEAEKARADGQQFGQAVAALYEADTAEEANAAVADLEIAAQESREHAGDAVGDQVDKQVDALARAVDGFVGMHTTDDEWDAELYEYELDVAAEDLVDQAEEFRTESPEVVEAFWEGVDSEVELA
jgi:hypothetical protein